MSKTSHPRVPRTGDTARSPREHPWWRRGIRTAAASSTAAAPPRGRRPRGGDPGPPHQRHRGLPAHRESAKTAAPPKLRNTLNRFRAAPAAHRQFHPEKIFPKNRRTSAPGIPRGSRAAGARAAPLPAHRADRTRHATKRTIRIPAGHSTETPVRGGAAPATIHVRDPAPGRTRIFGTDFRTNLRDRSTRRERGTFR
ncbi:hypothetical protein GCM10027174_30700 [Salinifilum aidingensis]